jgi:hypothetical protein
VLEDPEQVEQQVALVPPETQVVMELLVVLVSEVSPVLRVPLVTPVHRDTLETLV